MTVLLMGLLAAILATIAAGVAFMMLALFLSPLYCLRTAKAGQSGRLLFSWGFDAPMSRTFLFWALLLLCSLSIASYVTGHSHFGIRGIGIPIAGFFYSGWKLCLCRAHRYHLTDSGIWYQVSPLLFPTLDWQNRPCRHLAYWGEVKYVAATGDYLVLHYSEQAGASFKLPGVRVPLPAASVHAPPNGAEILVAIKRLISGLPADLWQA